MVEAGAEVCGWGWRCVGGGMEVCVGGGGGVWGWRCVGGGEVTDGSQLMTRVL